MHPGFICIGAQKAGTDWLYDQFAAHRDFWMPPIKEIAFFDKGFGGPRIKLAKRRLNWRMEKHGKGREDYTYDIAFLLRMLHGAPRPRAFDFRAYFALFDTKPGISGDCTPGYCRLNAEMARQIMAQMPDTKILLLLRDPVDRLWSQALMHTRLERQPGEDPTATLDDFAAFALNGYVRNFSFLSETIRTWRSVDTQGRFKVFLFDDMIADAQAYRSAIAAHVGADPEGFSLPAHFNRKAKQPGKKPIPEEFRLWAARYFEREYRALEDLLGGTTATWRARNDALLGADAPGHAASM